MSTGTIPADTFAARLMLVRVHAGYITINEAAEKTGLNYGSWSNWERGMRPRDIIDVAERISTALGVDRDWLLFGGPLSREQPKATVTKLTPGTTGQYPEANSHLADWAARASTAGIHPPATTPNGPVAALPSAPVVRAAARRPGRVIRPATG